MRLGLVQPVPAARHLPRRSSRSIDQLLSGRCLARPRIDAGGRAGSVERLLRRYRGYRGRPVVQGLEQPNGSLVLEVSLYLPVKRFLEDLGFRVKGEVGGCDLVALKDALPPIVVIGELKLTFNLELVLQGVDRAAASDEVWLAARLSARGKGRESDPRFRNLCRRLGFGLLGVSPAGEVQVLVSPAAALPRKDQKRRSRLVEEHRRRQGDPTAGGSVRQPIMTAYRQQALACASALAAGRQQVRDVRSIVPEAPKILRRNVYGWFERVERGVYELTTAGHQALTPKQLAVDPARMDEAM